MFTRAIAGSLCAIGVASAQGAISFTFADPSSGLEVTHTAGAAPDGVSGLLTYNNQQPLDLIVYSDEAGFAGATYTNATLTMEVVVGPAFGLGGFAAAQLGDVHFEFRDMNGDLLLTGDSGGGGLSVIGGTSGGWTTNSTDDGGGLVMEAHGALLGELQSASLGQLIAAFDAAFTLTNITPVASVSGDYFTSFEANSAFTGTANVPTPGAIALLGVAGLITRRRTRG